MSSIHKKQFDFIIGAPRSGTTCLHAMIAEHPDIAATPQVEQTFFSRYLVNLVREWEFELFHIEQGNWIQGLPYLWTKEEFNLFVKYFFEKVYLKIFEKKPDATHVLDKHPDYSHHIDLIKRTIPNAKFVHVIRDGRDVVVSMISATKRIGFGAGNIEAVSDAWKRHVQNAMKAKVYGEKHYLEIRYEELIEHGKLSLPKVFDFCELDYTNELINSINDKTIYSSSNPNITHSERKMNIIWKNKLSLKQKYIFNNIAGDLLVELGYAKKGWWAESRSHLLVLPLLAKILVVLKRIALASAELMGPKLTTRIKEAELTRHFLKRLQY